MEKVSILMLNINRLEETKKSLESITKGLARDSYELLICDNGSTDKRVIDYIQSLKPEYHRLNSKNEGVAGGFNQLLLRATGRYILIAGNDIVMPAGAIPKFIEYYKKIPKAGIIGMSWGAACPPLQEVNGTEIHKTNEVLNRIFGDMFFGRELLDDVGYFCEEYFPYGLEDSDFNERVLIAGYTNFYIPKWTSTHIGWDTDEKSEYRIMKNNSLSANLTKFSENLEKYNKTKQYYIGAELKNNIY